MKLHQSEFFLRYPIVTYISILVTDHFSIFKTSSAYPFNNIAIITSHFFSFTFSLVITQIHAMQMTSFLLMLFMIIKIIEDEKFLISYSLMCVGVL
jgi:hypothetical protein